MTSMGRFGNQESLFQPVFRQMFRQIFPILLYGCSVWCVPKTHNLCYIEGQPENVNTRNAVTNILSSIMNRTVQLIMAHLDFFLIKLKYYSDKQELFRAVSNSIYQISKFEEKESDIEKVHNDFCKKSINISKYASNTAVQGELGRMPIINTSKGLLIKYWLRLSWGTENKLLNEAYQVCL